MSIDDFNQILAIPMIAFGGFLASTIRFEGSILYSRLLWGVALLAGGVLKLAGYGWVGSFLPLAALPVGTLMFKRELRSIKANSKRRG